MAFVEELWSFKTSSRSTNILTSEFAVRRLYRTSPPTPTHYCIDVWRIIGMWASVVFNCVSFTCEIDSDLIVNQVLRDPVNPTIPFGCIPKAGSPDNPSALADKRPKSRDGSELFLVDPWALKMSRDATTGHIQPCPCS